MYFMDIRIFKFFLLSIKTAENLYPVYNEILMSFFSDLNISDYCIALKMKTNHHPFSPSLSSALLYCSMSFDSPPTLLPDTVCNLVHQLILRNFDAQSLFYSRWFQKDLGSIAPLQRQFPRKEPFLKD